MVTRTREYQVASDLASADGPALCMPNVGLERRPATRRVRIRAAVLRPVAMADAIDQLAITAGHPFVNRRWLGEWRPLSKRPVRPVFVVVLRVGAGDALEVAAPEDQ
jgi:hypothetical protein